MARWVWLRLGDQGNYEEFDTPYKAGAHVGAFLAAIGYKAVGNINRVRLGATVNGFQGNDYVSLFWGDDDAQPIDAPGLSTSEFEQFSDGIEQEHREYA